MGIWSKKGGMNNAFLLCVRRVKGQTKPIFQMILPDEFTIIIRTNNTI